MENKKVLNETVYLTSERIIGMVSSLIIGALVARYLGPKDFGTIQYLISIIFMLTPFSQFGLNNVIIKKILDGKERTEEIIAAGFFIKFFLSCLIYLLGFLYFLFYDNELKNYYAVMGIFIIFQSLEVFNFYFSAILKNKYNAISNIISNILNSAIKLLFIAFSFSLVYFAFSFVLLQIITSLMTIYFLIRKGNLNNKTILRLPHNLVFKTLIKDAAPLFIGGVGTAIMMKIDQFMIGKYLGLYSVGIYSVAVQITTAFYFLPTIITTVMFPIINRYYEKDKKKYRETSVMFTKVLFFVSIISSIFIMVFAKLIVTLMFGYKYLESVEVLWFYSVLTIFISLQSSVNSQLIIERKNRLIMYNTLLGATLNIVLNYMLIPFMGIKGAIIASMIAYFVSLYLFLYIIKGTREIINIINEALKKLISITSYKKLFSYLISLKGVKQ